MSFRVSVAEVSIGKRRRKWTIVKCSFPCYPLTVINGLDRVVRVIPRRSGSPAAKSCTLVPYIQNVPNLMAGLPIRCRLSAKWQTQISSLLVDSLSSSVTVDSDSDSYSYLLESFVTNHVEIHNLCFFDFKSRKSIDRTFNIFISQEKSWWVLVLNSLLISCCGNGIGDLRVSRTATKSTCRLCKPSLWWKTMLG